MHAFLRQIHPVPTEMAKDYNQLFESVVLKRGELLCEPGQIQRYLYFVEEGYQRSFLLHDGKEHTMAFTYAPSFSGVPESFYTQSPSRYYLQCLTASRFLRISHRAHEEFLQEHHAMDILFRKGTEMLLKGTLERQYELMALTIEERFRLFMKRSGHLLQVIPQKHIASYLRIDATNLSRLLNSVNL